MERMGGKEQLLEQMYSAIATQKDETVDLALRSYGQLAATPLSHIPDVASSTLVVTQAIDTSLWHARLLCGTDPNAMGAHPQGVTWWVHWELRWTG